MVMLNNYRNTESMDSDAVFVLSTVLTAGVHGLSELVTVHVAARVLVKLLENALKYQTE